MGIFNNKKNDKPIILFDNGWKEMLIGINKLIHILDDTNSEQFTEDEYMQLYTVIYTMCTQRDPHDYSPQLYVKYREIYENYIVSTVIPNLNVKYDEFMLEEMNNWIIKYNYIYQL